MHPSRNGHSGHPRAINGTGVNFSPVLPVTHVNAGQHNSAGKSIVDRCTVPNPTTIVSELLSRHELTVLTCVTGLAEPLEKLEALVPDLPGEVGDYVWRRTVFRLAWALQTLGYRDQTDPGVRALVRAWLDRRVGCRGSVLAILEEMEALWERVRNPDGLTFAEIFHRPDVRPLPTAVCGEAGEPAWEFLVRGCRNLHDYWPEGVPWPLSCRAAEMLLKAVMGEEGPCYRTTNRMLQKLARLRVLREVEKGSRRRIPGTEKGTASTWLWIARGD
jgi:hypothetical protein